MSGSQKEKNVEVVRKKNKTKKVNYDQSLMKLAIYSNTAIKKGEGADAEFRQKKKKR
jgi:hypothetical protein